MISPDLFPPIAMWVIRDLGGRILKSGLLTGEAQQEIAPGRCLAPGLYLLSLEAGGNYLETAKIVVQ